MTTTTTTTNPCHLIIDTLLGAEAPLTAGEIALAVGLPCNAARAALENLDTHVSSVLVEREGKKVRVFSATDLARCAREAVLVVLAEQGSEEALRAETRETLRAAALAFGVDGVRVKATKDALIERILRHRENLNIGVVCVKCNAEPVDAAGQTCTVCEESASLAPATPGAPRAPRKPRAPRADGDLRIRIRRPDVTLDLNDVERGIAERIVKKAQSAREAQREVGIWLAERSDTGLIDAEVLRTILRTHGVLNAPNFTINAKKDGWTRVEENGALKGWTIPNLNITATPKVSS